MNTCIFDIETAPLPDAELLRICGEFCADDVKLGNVKDPDKIAAKLAEAEASYLSDLRGKAALDALTGRVLAIGWKVAGSATVEIIGHDDERDTIAAFWGALEGLVQGGRLPTVAGFNTHKFDLPFLFKRSWAHRLTPPAWLRNGRYWSNHSLDLRDVWQMGDRETHGSLDKICKHLGMPGKTGNGKDFAKLWLEDRGMAAAYLTNDVLQTEQVWRVLTGGGVA